MPVYNTGEILHDTIKSILNQTYSNFELLLIDDGSMDGSGDVCDDYAAQDSRVKTYHKKNGGICDARNFGLSKCSGKYIAFCDHDDLFETSLLKTVYFEAEKYNADVVKFRYKEISENSTYTLEAISDSTIVLCDLKNSLFELNSIGYFVTIWSFLYRADWLKNTNQKFDVLQKHGGEDYDFNIKLVPYIKCLVILPDILYLHFIRGNLSTSAKMYDDIILHFLYTQKLLNEVSNKIDCDIQKQVLPFIKYYGQCILNFISGANKLGKSYMFIDGQLREFSSLNIVRRFLNIKNIYVSFRVNPKETAFYVLSLLRMNSLSFFLYKIIKYVR